MQYLLMLYIEDSRWETMTPAEQAQGIAAYSAYAQALGKSGALVGSNRLQASATATCVTNTNGKTHVVDGPYPDTKEQLGGYFLIDVPNLDAALDWAARCPAASHGTVEVRPVWPQP